MCPGLSGLSHEQVVRPDVICIEQHIIAHDKKHHLQIDALGTKINPNVERGRTFSGDFHGDYFHKYPFGTIHYIIALLAREGIEVQLPDFMTPFISPSRHKTNLGQIIMRADDALFSSLSAYAENAMKWWQYLSQTSDCRAIRQMIQFIHSCDKNMAISYKDDIDKFFMSLGCDGKDGAFNNIMNTDNTLQARVQDFYALIKSVMGLSSLPPLPSQLILHEGKFLKTSMRIDSDTSILHQSNLYSYAYIYGPFSRYPNFSYTTHMK